jgi:hypothetical protein
MRAVKCACAVCSSLCGWQRHGRERVTPGLAAAVISPAHCERHASNKQTTTTTKKRYRDDADRNKKCVDEKITTEAGREEKIKKRERKFQKKKALRPLRRLLAPSACKA